MTTKVGEGYIEVETRIDNDSLSRAATTMAQRFAATFNKHLTREINTHTDNDIGGRIAGAISRGFGRGLTQSARQVSDFGRTVHRRIDRDSVGWGERLFHNMGKAFDGFLSILPARLESVFTKTGPVIGTVLLAGLAAALAIGMPALGAMASGLFFAGFGLSAAVAAAIVGAIKDPRVNAAWNRLWTHFTNAVVYDKRVQFLGQVLAKQLDKVSKALDRWAPHIQNILIAGAKFMPGIFDTFIAATDRLLPVMDKLANSPFVSSLVAIFNTGIVKIFDAFAISFERFLSDKNAMEGAKLGLEDFFDLLAGSIKLIFDFLRWLSRMWYELNRKRPEWGDRSVLDKIREGWKAIKDVLDDIFSIIHEIGSELNTAFGKGSSLDKSIDMWDSLKKDAQEYLDIIRGILSAAAGSDKPTALQRQQSMFGSGKKLPYGSLGQGGQDRNGDAFGFGDQSGGMKAWLKNQGQDILAEFKIIGQTLRQHWQSFWDWFRGGWKRLWDDTFGKWASKANEWLQVVGAVITAVGGWFSRLVGLVTGPLLKVQSVWFQVWSYIGLYLGAVWRGIWNTVTSWFSQVLVWFTSTLSTVIGRWRSAWSLVGLILGAIWNGIWTTVTSWFTKVIVWFTGMLITVKNRWQSAWDTIGQILGAAWNGIYKTVTSWFDRMWTALQTGLNSLRTGWRSVWNGIHGFVAGIWDKISGVVRTGVNAMILVINSGIGLINKALSKLGVDWKIPSIGLVTTPGIRTGAGTAFPYGNTGQGRASGGKIYGPGSRTSDSIPALLSRDEYVIRASSAMDLGYRNLDYMNRTGNFPHTIPDRMAERQGFASGGRVGSANNALLNEHRNHLHVAMSQGMNYVIALAKKSGIPFHVSSTFRPGATVAGGGRSWHAVGKAVDFGGFNQDRLAAYFMRLPGILEVIHRTAMRDYAIFGGKPAAGGAGMMSGIFQWLGKGWGWVMDHLLKPAGNKAASLFGGGTLMKELGKGAIKGIFNAVVKKAKGEFDNANQAMSAGAASGGGGGAKQWAGVASIALRMLGLPSSWLGPLLTLIGRESGGNPRAINLWDSNARAGQASRGLMQTIPSTFNAYKFPGYNNIFGPLDNILAGLRYIKARYGSIFNVQQAVGATPKGYDNGGPLRPGEIGINTSRSTEMVLTGSQADALQRRIEGDGGDFDVDVHIHDDYIEAILYRNGQELSRKLKAGKRRV